MILDGIKKAFGLKDTISEFFSTLNFILKVKDRLDDDLDANGKSELEDIFTSLKFAETKIISTVSDVSIILKDVIARGKKLQLHVLEGEK